MQEEKDTNRNNKEMNKFKGMRQITSMLVSFGIGNSNIEIKRNNFLIIAAINLKYDS
jgi:hypothetical protein